MNIIEIRPVCGSLGVEVELSTVKSILKVNLNVEINEDDGWYICSGNDCEVTYFLKNNRFSIKDV
jgi:hypothetical protein